MDLSFMWICLFIFVFHCFRLTKTKQEFVDIMDNLNLAYPKRIDESVPLNMQFWLQEWNLKILPCLSHILTASNLIQFPQEITFSHVDELFETIILLTGVFRWIRIREMKCLFFALLHLCVRASQIGIWIKFLKHVHCKCGRISFNFSEY